MPTLITGLLHKNKVNGFTLVEFLVVILIIGLFSALISIRIEGSLSGGDLRLATRVIMGEINQLRGKAASTHKEQVLGLNVDENYLYTYHPLPEKEDLSSQFQEEHGDYLKTIKRLPDGVNLEDVVIFSKGKIQEGEARIRFFANGCIDRSLIHLTNEKDEKYTLQINPITGQITVYDKYIDQKME
ncbi:MAG: type II secretion system protein [Desulfobacteraceae bacterium]|nr:type II secretion system protein [Desulfobacteraceae bacterium]